MTLNMSPMQNAEKSERVPAAVGSAGDGKKGARFSHPRTKSAFAVGGAV
jgi:hypothetical protein